MRGQQFIPENDLEIVVAKAICKANCIARGYSVSAATFSSERDWLPWVPEARAAIEAVDQYKYGDEP